MNVDVLVYHLADYVVIASRTREQIISRVNSHVRFLWIDVTLNENSESSTVTSDNKTALASSA